MKSAKLLLITIALLLGSMTTSAIPVKPGMWATLTLADGTTVRAEVFGNEYGCWFQDVEGRCYVRQGDSYIETDRETIDARRKASMAARHVGARRAIFASTVSGLGTKGRCTGGAMYSVGEYSIPVLMVEFSDMKFSQAHGSALIQDYLTKEGFQYTDPNTQTTHGVGSIRDYFVAQSQGKFKPNFKLLGKVTINKPYAYYGKNSAKEKDEHCSELPGDAMRAAKEQLSVDFTQFSKPAPDKRHTAGIPLLCMLYAGEGEMYNTQNPDLIWPHQFDYRGKGTEIEGIVGGGNIHLSSYFVGNELVMVEQEGGSNVERLMGIGVFCHELGHSLGLPDWYCTDDAVEKQYPKMEIEVLEPIKKLTSVVNEADMDLIKKLYQGKLAGGIRENRYLVVREYNQPKLNIMCDELLDIERVVALYCKRAEL